MSGRPQPCSCPWGSECVTSNGDTRDRATSQALLGAHHSVTAQPERTCPGKSRCGGRDSAAQGPQLAKGGARPGSLAPTQLFTLSQLTSLTEGGWNKKRPHLNMDLKER